MTRRRLALPIARAAAALGAVVAAAAAEGAFAPDRPEPGSVEAIARFTTEPRFSNPWVAYVPESESVPSPADQVGRVAGAPGELSRSEAVYAYFRELDRASARVLVETIGKTEEGRDILLAAISDEQNIRRLPDLKRATALLADPRVTTPEQAERILATARPFYYFNAGLHSTETGSPEMVMELAYRLAVSEQPTIRRIRENVVVLINPVSEPDGRDKMVDWFYRHLKGRTDFEDLPRLSPPYWGHYVFHDNNRDTHQAALELTRAVHRMFFDYHPTVVHDLHESIPLLHTWNGTGPYNANLDPIVTNEWLEMSFHEVTALTAMGMPGVWTWGFGESWGLHYLDSIASNHNSIGRGYETFGNATAETVERRLRPDEERYAGRAVTTREWYRAWPPDRGLVWSLRNNVNYMESGCLAILDWSARHAQDLLRNFYRKGLNSWRKGREGKPRAFAIDADQGDRRRVAEMINLLTAQRIEVGRAASEIAVGEKRLPKGTFVVRLDQPYRNYAVDLLEHQSFPSDAAYEPYDDVSWSLPAHFGLEVTPIEEEREAQVPLEPVREPVLPQGKVRGSGPYYLLADEGQEALLAARARLSRFEVGIAEQTFRAPGPAGREQEYAAGSWIIPSAAGLREALEAVASELGLDFTAWDPGAAGPPGARHDAPWPRLAVWHTWADTEAVGWIRLILDRQKVPYDYIRDEEIRDGRLWERYDVLLHADVGLDLKDQIHGIDPRHGPLAYTRTAEFPSHGVPDASEDITGGIGWAGMASLQEFTRRGGLLVTLGNGSALALDGGLARRVERRSSQDLFTPGVELKARFLVSGHPLTYGYPEITSVFRTQLPVYDVGPADRARVVLQWGTRPRREDREEGETDRPPREEEKKEEESMLVSGGIKGADGLEGRPAILDLPVGRGRVLAYNFNPLHRDQNRSDHRLLWNAVLNWRALPASVP